MEEFDKKMWDKMISILYQYREGDIDFKRMVMDLEGTLDASNISDKKLINNWYDYWTPLEITNSIYGRKVSYKEVKKDVDAMIRFLKRHRNFE